MTSYVNVRNSLHLLTIVSVAPYLIFEMNENESVRNYSGCKSILHRLVFIHVKSFCTHNVLITFMHACFHSLQFVQCL